MELLEGNDSWGQRTPPPCVFSFREDEALGLRLCVLLLLAFTLEHVPDVQRTVVVYHVSYAKQVTALQAGDEVFELRVVLRSQIDGSSLPVHLLAFRIQDADGHYGGLAAVAVFSQLSRSCEGCQIIVQFDACAVMVFSVLLLELRSFVCVFLLIESETSLLSYWGQFFEFLCFSHEFYLPFSSSDGFHHYDHPCRVNFTNSQRRRTLFFSKKFV